MLHPVLPPAPLPLPTVEDTGTKNFSASAPLPLTASSLNATPINSTQNESLVAQALSKPSPPETFPAEFSSTKNAASLGPRLVIGYPLQDLEVPLSQNDATLDASTNTQLVRNEVQSTVARSKTITQKLAQQVLESPQKPSDNTNSTQIGAPEPIKIQFNSQNQNSQSRPSTIEFKSRSQINQSPTTAPQGDSTTGQQSQPVITPPSNTPPETRRVIEVIADRQEYDEQRRVVTAEGHVLVRFDGSVVDADRLQVSLDNLIAVGEGNVALTRGEQILRGQRFTYNFLQDNGELLSGRGDIFIPSAGRDLSFQPNDVNTRGVQPNPLSDRIRATQPLQANSPGAVNFSLGGTVDAINVPRPKQGGQVRRLRFQAARVDFDPKGWVARDVRITNDPFSPPELELRADKVTLTRESPLRDTIKTQRQRLVFDQNTSVPIPRDEQVIDRSPRDVSPPIASIGYDGDQRGGFFIERNFKPINTETVRLSLAPQFFLQKAVQNSNSFADVFGLRSRLSAVLGPSTTVEGFGLLTSVDLGKIEDNFRGSLRLRQSLGEVNPYLVTLESSYRNRLYNGSLGYQTVQSSVGGVITSPVIPLAKTGFNLRYQGSAQYINANTDRQDLKTNGSNDRISLARVQGSASVDGGFFLWQGKGLAPTATEGLRYTPNPVVPYLRAVGGVTGTTSYYSDGDNQTTFTGSIGLEGQFGHFSRSFLDYTAFSLRYSQGIFIGSSPFLFDRAVDNKVLNAGISQQLYGPFRLGFQTSINLDTGRSTSTDYILEYSRRTYGITLRYNPDLKLGGINFRISDFNWTGGTNPFSDNSEVRPVVNGVEQDY